MRHALQLPKPALSSELTQTCGAVAGRTVKALVEELLLGRQAEWLERTVRVNKHTEEGLVESWEPRRGETLPRRLAVQTNEQATEILRGQKGTLQNEQSDTTEQRRVDAVGVRRPPTVVSANDRGPTVGGPGWRVTHEAVKDVTAATFDIGVVMVHDRNG